MHILFRVDEIHTHFHIYSVCLTFLVYSWYRALCVWSLLLSSSLGCYTLALFRCVYELLLLLIVALLSLKTLHVPWACLWTETVISANQCWVSDRAQHTSHIFKMKVKCFVIFYLSNGVYINFEAEPKTTEIEIDYRFSNHLKWIHAVNLINILWISTT